MNNSAYTRRLVINTNFLPLARQSFFLYTSLHPPSIYHTPHPDLSNSTSLNLHPMPPLLLHLLLEQLIHHPLLRQHPNPTKRTTRNLDREHTPAPPRNILHVQRARRQALRERAVNSAFGGGEMREGVLGGWGGGRGGRGVGPRCEGDAAGGGEEGGSWCDCGGAEGGAGEGAREEGEDAGG